TSVMNVSRAVGTWIMTCSFARHDAARWGWNVTGRDMRLAGRLGDNGTSLSRECQPCYTRWTSFSRCSVVRCADASGRVMDGAPPHRWYADAQEIYAKRATPLCRQTMMRRPSGCMDCAVAIEGRISGGGPKTPAG